MTAVVNQGDYLAGLLNGHDSVAQSGSTWLRDLRSRAVERANELTVPTTRDEDWRFTDLSALYRIPFHAAATAATADFALVKGYAVEEAEVRLVFVDGRYAPEFSTPKAGDGVSVGNLAEMPAAVDAIAKAHLGKLAPLETDSFTAVNTAFLRDGAVVHVARNRVAGKPIHLLFLAISKDVAAYPRVLVVAESGAQCTIIEDFVGASDATYFTDAVSEIFVGERAAVSHVKLQREAIAAFHVAGTSVKVENAGRYSSWNVAFGARISRQNLNVVQAGEGTEFLVDGLALIDGRQLADMHSSIDHAHAMGGSRQLHKTIVGGAAHAVFNGKILVREGAQRTDSGQQSRNLLLSGRAHVDTKPQLEIFADDVKCAHGAAVGQIEADELFYLKTRGLSDTAARNLLTYAFAAEVIERIPVKSLVERLEQTVLEQTQTKETA